MRHRHPYKGQTLIHSHEGGDKPHGYYQHAEDAGTEPEPCQVTGCVYREGHDTSIFPHRVESSQP